MSSEMAIAAWIAMYAGYGVIGLIGPVFLILAIMKIFGSKSIHWFAWPGTYGVFTTPIWMLVIGGGLISWSLYVFHN
jgi:uncharacterized PurR-regulated membrane protein YhhQ (DUF165 family)